MEHSFLSRSFAFKLLALALSASAPAVVAQTPGAPASHPFAQSKPVPGQYIVVFKSSVSNPAAEAANIMSGIGGQLRHVYSSAIKGFAASLPDAAVQGLRNNPNVDYIEQDQTVALNQSSQSPATWGLDRIDQRDRPLDTNYSYNYTGAGVNAFIIDTGILATHGEFSGRVQLGYNAVADNNGTNDCNGHGTHVAGTVGGTTWGVAKAVTLIPVRVLDCAGSGTYAGVIAGVDWVAGSNLRPAVANMSLGGGKSTTMNAAVAGAVNQGVTMVVAAGNDNRTACNYSPASEPSAITVGATTSSDARASYSNYGTCVDIFAPGSSITSAWNTSTTATNTISGTSMATPHVTGAAVLALQAALPTTTTSPAAVASFLVANASPNKLSSIGTGSPNLLLYSLAAGAPTEPVKQTVAVSSIATKAIKIVGSTWRAEATVTIGDADPAKNWAPVANATVSGSFSPGGSASCLTGSNGSCKLSSAKISGTSTTLTVTNVSGTNLIYDSSKNVVAAPITINKP